MIEYIGIGVAAAGALGTTAGAVLAYRTAKKLSNPKIMGMENRSRRPKASAGTTQQTRVETRAQRPQEREWKPLRQGGDPAIAVPPARTAARTRSTTPMTRAAPAATR